MGGVWGPTGPNGPIPTGGPLRGPPVEMDFCSLGPGWTPKVDDSRSTQGCLTMLYSGAL